MSQFSSLSPFAFPGDPFADAMQPRQPRAPAIPALPEAEKQSLLEKIGSAGLGGLSFIGGILNKPGRIVRGALGGHFDELGNVIPFSDALGITDPSREVHGHDLLKNVGLTQEDNPSFFSPEGLAGFAADLATDPLTYMSFGGHALSKAGLAAKKAGALGKTTAERIALGQGGHVGMGLPFGGNAATFDLAPAASAINKSVRYLPGGNALADFTGNLASKGADLYNKTIPPLFQGSVLGQTAPEAQAAARKVTEAIPGAQAAARERVGALTGQLPSVASGGLPDALESRGLRAALEAPGTPTGPFADLVQGQRSLQDADLAMANRLGHPDLPLVDPEVAYAKRSLAFNDNPQGAFGSSLRPQGQGPGRALPKGVKTEEVINTLSRDEKLLPLRQGYNAGQTDPWVNAVKQTMGLDEPRLDALRTQSKMHNPAFNGAPFAHADELASLEAKAKAAENVADWIATSVPEGLAKKGIGAFETHPHVDLQTKLVKSAERFLKTEGLHEAVAAMAAHGAEGVPLSEVLTKAGLTYKDANGNMTAMARTLEAMQKQNRLPAGASLADLAEWTIPHDQVDRLTKFTQASSAPAGLKPFLNIWDSVTNLTKAMQTAIWPANWARNKAQDLFQSWVHDAYNAQASGPMKYLKPIADSKAWRDGKIIEGASAYPGLTHLSDEAASKVLRGEIENLNIHGAFKGHESDLLGGDFSVKKLLPDVPGDATPRKGFGEILKGYVPTSLAEANPLSVAGVNKQTADVFAPIKAGREVSQELDAMSRVSTYLAKRSQGFEPAAARAESLLAHFDYGNLAPFERDVMKRVIPFYNFSRQNVPAVIKELGENPGGKLAASLKATVAMKGDHPGFLPSQVSSGIAAPIGAETDGQQRYLTHLGLGFEDLGNLAGPGGPLGLLNPLIKAPIESLTGRQLISGRDLADLHSRIGDTTGVTPPPLLENLLMNSPAGRAIGTASTLVDPRKTIADKAMNTLTGARLSDVDVDASRRRAVMDALTSQLHGPGIRHFESLSVRPEDFAQMDPFQQRIYQLYRDLSRRGSQVPASR